MYFVAILTSLICTLHFSFAGNGSHSSSPHSASSHNFDWNAYLLESMDSPHINHLSSPQDHNAPLSRAEAKTEQHAKSMSPMYEMGKEQLTSRQKSYLKQKAKKAVRTPEEKQAYLLKRREQQHRNYITTKEKTGYTTLHNARVNQIRELEKIGQASVEQTQFLNKDRDRKRASRLKKTLRLHASGLVKKRVRKDKGTKDLKGHNGSSQG